MSTIYSNGQCVICNSTHYTIKYEATNTSSNTTFSAFECTTGGYGSHGRIVRCTECGHMYTFPRLTNQELVEMYTNVQDITYVQERKGRELTFAKHLKHLEQYTGPGVNKTLLDVGAYTGIFVKTATAAGWSAFGVEPSVWCVEIAKKEGVHLIQGTLESHELVGKQFDAITMWDVIEHVDDPVSLIKQATLLLKPNGILAVHTMNTSSIASKILGHKWPWYMDMHVHYFSKKGLVRLITEAGYTPLWVGAEGRLLTMQYFANRLEAFFKPVGKIARLFTSLFKMNNVTIPVNFGDIITVYAQKK